jgi:hypothetical protein
MGIIPAIGFTMIARMIITKKLAVFLFFGFVLTSFFKLSIIGIACIVGIIVALWAFNRNRFAGVKERKMTTNSKKVGPKDLWWIFWRSCKLDAFWDYDRQQHLGYSYSISFAVDKLHKNNPEKKKKTLKRVLNLWRLRTSF